MCGRRAIIFLLALDNERSIERSARAARDTTT